MFYEYCTKCSKAFQNETEWNTHNMRHRRKIVQAEKKENPELVKKVAVPDVTPLDVEDERLEKCRDLRSLKKILKEHGIECSTMKKAEAQQAFEELVATGKVI